MPKAIRFSQLGGPEVLHIEDLPNRQPGPGEVLLKVEAVGLNRAESMYYHGVYMEKVIPPSGIGYEALGKVVAVGPEVDPALIGKRFGTIPGFSMYQYAVLAEEAVVPASVLAAVPESFSAVEGAASTTQRSGAIRRCSNGSLHRRLWDGWVKRTTLAVSWPSYAAMMPDGSR